MIFLSLLAAGALVGLALGTWRGLALEAADAASSGAAGAFLLGGIAIGLADRSVGPFDPIVLAAGAIGAVACVRLMELLSGGGRSGPGRRTTPPATGSGRRECG